MSVEHVTTEYGAAHLFVDQQQGNAPFIGWRASRAAVGGVDMAPIKLNPDSILCDSVPTRPRFTIAAKSECRSRVPSGRAASDWRWPGRPVRAAYAPGSGHPDRGTAPDVELDKASDAGVDERSVRGVRIDAVHQTSRHIRLAATRQAGFPIDDPVADARHGRAGSCAGSDSAHRSGHRSARHR